MTKFSDHLGHHVVVAVYGDPDDPASVTIECKDCGVVLAEEEILVERYDLTLSVPAVWQDLLDIEEIPDNAPRGIGSYHLSPRPRRDDARYVYTDLGEDDYYVWATLQSGNDNYWLVVHVESDQHNHQDDSDPSHSLSESYDLELHDGRIVTVRLVGTADG